MNGRYKELLLALALIVPATAQAEGLFAVPTPLWRAPAATGTTLPRPVQADFGVLGGRCNTIGLSGMLGGRWGFAQPGGNGVAMLIGRAWAPNGRGPGGSSIDSVDRGCIGNTLELAPSYHAVRWVNNYSKVAYVVTPMRAMTRNGVPCREFHGQMTVAGRPQALRGFACRTGEGMWQAG